MHGRTALRWWCFLDAGGSRKAPLSWRLELWGQLTSRSDKAVTKQRGRSSFCRLHHLGASGNGMQYHPRHPVGWAWQDKSKHGFLGLELRHPQPFSNKEFSSYRETRPLELTRLLFKVIWWQFQAGCVPGDTDESRRQ